MVTIPAQSAPLTEALRSADWSGISMGNKALIQAAIEQLAAQSAPDEREALWQLIHDVLRNYRMSTLDDGYGGGYPLIDAMTADGQPVSGGIEECTYLADAIWNSLGASWQRAQSAPVVPEGMNKTREQWQKVDPKYCADNNSPAANFYLIRDAQQDIERLHRALAAALQPAARQEQGDEVRRLREALETERQRLAACGVAALGYFDGCADEYKSASLSDVLSLRTKYTELLSWAVGRWEAEVKNRPLANVHRRSLDDTWRQVIRQLGGDPVVLCGPDHDTLSATPPEKP